MKSLLVIFAGWSSLCLAVLILPGCSKKKMCAHTYSTYLPVYKTTAEVRANIKSNSQQKITKPGKIYIKGAYIFLNEIDKGIHIIDNSNPGTPKNIAFIDIPGNQDLAVKGNMLYADLYTDLVSIDITDPLNVVTKNIIDNAFPQRLYTNGFQGDKNKVIVNWVVKDTTIMVDCSPRGRSVQYDMVSAVAFNSPFGTGGSMARFAIVNSMLYTVGLSDLNAYSITIPESPMFASKVNMGWNIETVYPFKDRLFIGSTSGMFIFDISKPSSPSKLGQFSHVTACDPVIADENYAFVTLSSGARCSNAANQMDVLDISNLTAPTLLKTYPMTNPHGISKDGNTLFVCDGKEGLKIYDAVNVKDLKLVIQMKGFESYDVIAFNKIAIVVSKDGLRQYDYSNLNDIKLLSKIGWEG